MFVTTGKHVSRMAVFGILILALLLTQAGGAYALRSDQKPDAQANAFAIVFVSRGIPGDGTVYMEPNESNSMPGVGPYSRFQVAAPGKLIVREANGALRTLVDGSRPTAASLNLVDVNAPDVSYDGTKIVFAGLAAGSYSTEPLTNPGAWRIYVINVDGSGLQQITLSDQDNLSLAQFGQVAGVFKKYDDTDPAWMPDGRIVLSSTRWPSISQYGGVRTSNLYVVNADGSNLHRITSERNGADRPLIDPVTGRIVYSRWWRNARFAIDSMETVYVDPSNPAAGYIWHEGLSGKRSEQLVRYDFLWRNAWHPATINPDGTGVALWSGGSLRTDVDNHYYGGGFADNGSLYGNFFPMKNMTEASGFGGIRLYPRGPNGFKAIIGVTARNDSIYPLVKSSPPSHGVYQSAYAADPEMLPDGRLVISWAKDHFQDYGLYIINPDGSGLTPLYDNPGTTELRARLIRVRPKPPIIRDRITQAASLLPPSEQGPYDKDGTFTFQALNVYFNAPVDTDILSAMPVGAAGSIRFFLDHQRSAQPGATWPIFLKEVPVNPDGSITTSSPANLPLFEQIRSPKPGYTVPLTGRNALPEDKFGAAHVAGMNFGRPGEVASCVGCHAGHSLIPVPSNPEDAKWTNLAPGATIQVSSLDSSLPNSNGLTDRRVKMQIPENQKQKYWVSKSGQDPNTQWVQLTFPVPVTVRTVRLYNLPGADSSIKVQAATVKLFSDSARTNLVGTATSGSLSDGGTDVAFNDVPALVVRVEMNSVSGSAAGLAEVEVIASGGGSTNNSPTVTPAGSLTPATPTYTFTPTAINATPATSTYTFTPTAINATTATATYTPSPTALNFTPASPTYTFTPTSVNDPASTPTLGVIPSPTMIVLSSPTPISTLPGLPTQVPPSLPTTDPKATSYPPASLNTQRGNTQGSIASLGTLKLSGNQDNPAEYVAFQPQNGRYAGYLSFSIPANIQPSSVSGVSLHVNFRNTAASRQTWEWSIYDWNAKKWVKIGKVTAKNSDPWQMLKFDLPMLPQYASSSREVRIQLRTNSGNGEARLDYEVLQLSMASIGAPKSAFLPTATITQSPSPTSVPPSSTPSPQE